MWNGTSWLVASVLVWQLGMVGCGGGGGSGGGADDGGNPGAGNTAPVAHAGADQSAASGATVTLDGSTSSDADGDALTCLWAMTGKPAGSQAVLTGATGPQPSFAADLDGSYVLQLIVNDGSLSSQADSVTVTVGDSGVPGGTLLDVGPGRAHEDLAIIDWPNLQAGDEVRIYWRQEPYRTKLGLRSRGTAAAPIRLTGVAGPNGERPVISGQNATTPPSLDNFFDTGPWSTETIGVITILRGPDDEWGYKPGYIEIQGLQIVGGHPDYRFTAMDGSLQSYGQGAAGIHANVVEHLTVRDCVISDNANGFFVLSRDSEAYLSRDILFEGNHLHGNGVVGSDQEHAIYTQASGITFQYNRIDALRTGAGGIALKDRSADTVIRYNWIVSGARTLDLVEPEDSYGLMLDEPGFRDTWVYGNVIINEHSSEHPYAVNMFHYGGDMGDASIYRKGTLHFFHNTVYIRMDQADEWNVTLFDLSTNDEAVDLRNNIFYRQGDALLYAARDAGNITFGANNWINAGWENNAPNDPWRTFSGTVTLATAPMEGASPGLADPPAHDFSVPAEAAVHDQAAALPGAYSAHPLARQYRPHLGGEGRSVEGTAFELGAMETAGATGGGAGYVTYSDANRVYRIAAAAGAAPEDISARLELASPALVVETGDACLNTSPDGAWLVLTAQRGDNECNGWPCLTLTDRAVSAVEVVRIGGNVVHPEGCTVAVTSGGDRIVYMDSGEGGHDWDLWLTQRVAPSVWQTPSRLTASSPYSFYGRPALSADGNKVVFECGNDSYAAHALCEVNTDATGFRVVLPTGGTFSSFRNPDYAADGSVLFEGEIPTEQIWKLAPGAPTPQLVEGTFTNDNSPCVLPDGSIASLWLNRPGSSGGHELKIMAADGSSYFMLLQDVDLPDIGLGCGL